MGLDIQIDYRFDDSGFFDDPAARAAMEAAADLWGALLLDDFAPVPVGTDFSVRNPSRLVGPQERVTLETEIDDIRIFVGAAELDGNTLAFAGLDGFDIVGDAYRSRVSGSFRDLGPVTDFEPFVGAITFDSDARWGFGIDAATPGRSDFLTTALHEIAHVLGVSTSPTFNLQREDGAFAGPNARAVNDGEAIPLTVDGHVADGFRGGTVLLDPTANRGARKLPTEVDLAILADIGYEIDGFEKVGTRFEIASEAGELILGRSVADAIDGLGGDDRIQGGAGDDTLTGGAGEDSLFGEAGADLFRIGPGSGLDRVLDFEVGIDRIAIDPAFGIAEAGALLALAEKPFANVTEFDLGQGSVLRVLHESREGTPLTAADFLLEGPSQVTGTAGADTLAGTDGADAISAGAGADAVLGSAGADRIDGGAGTDRVLYAVGREAIALTAADGGVEVALADGTDRLTGVEVVGILGGAFLLGLEGAAVEVAYRLFAAAFGRAPAEAGLAHWSGMIEAGRPAPDIADAFVASAEFAALIGPAPDDGAFVTALFETVLGRAPGADGRAHWTGQLASGALDRGDVLLAFSESAENVARTAPDLAPGVFVLAETDPLLL